MIWSRWITQVPPPDRRNIRLRTWIFEPGLMEEHGYKSLTDLAEAMQMSTGYLTKLRNGTIHEPGAACIKGALRAFPGKTMSDLFFVEYQ